MSFQLIIPGIEIDDYKDYLPDHFTGPVLKDAVIYAMRKNQVEISVQELKYAHYSIRHIYGKLVQDIEAREWYQNEGLCGCFVLKNTFTKNITVDETLILPHNHHSLYYTLSPDCRGKLHTPGVFEILEIFYSPELVQQFINYFPKLKNLIARQGSQYRDVVKVTPPLLQEIYMQLLQHSYESGSQRLYFDIKIRELLFHLLHSYIGENDPAVEFTPYEKGRIQEAKNILETYIDKKPPTIRELSRMVALNEFKLKKGFRQLFDAGIFEWISTKKMYHARKLVEETQKPLKEIAMMSGYPRITNFITAFRKQFGITPGSIRRS